jgi:hypothetical protein
MVLAVPAALIVSAADEPAALILVLPSDIFISELSLVFPEAAMPLKS